MSVNPAPVLAAIGNERLTIQNGKDHQHRRGWFMSGDIVLDQKRVATYVQHGDGSEPEITFIDDGQQALNLFFDSVSLKQAMVDAGMLRALDARCDLSYQISSVFECQYDRQYPVK